MSGVFRRIGLAIAFSPTAEVMLSQAYRLATEWEAELLLLHVGERTTVQEQRMDQLLAARSIDKSRTTVQWLQGDPAKVLVNTCRQAGIDLLITGALKKENILQYYVGSIARKVLRGSQCSVLTIVNPSMESSAWKNIVVNAEDSAYVEQAIRTACQLGQMTKGAWIHIVRELKLYGLTMAASDQFTEDEYEGARQKLVKQEIEKVEAILQRIPHEGLKINIKVVSGKSGFELPKFATRKSADLIVLGAPPRRSSFFDRLFPHDLEYLLADLPCNLLIVHQTPSHG